MDANEKLKPWGIWVHGCIDGDSRYVVYLEARSNKTSATVTRIFKEGIVHMDSAPSRVRGDYGTENNGVEEFMINFRGEHHRAYLRGRYVRSFIMSNNIPYPL